MHMALKVFKNVQVYIDFETSFVHLPKNNEIFKGKHTIIIKQVILKIDFIYGLLSLCFSFKI